MYVKVASTLFRLLGDEARLRLLRLLSQERLNVSELTAVLGIAQSGVSRHVGLLRDAGLVSEEREGGFTFLRATPDEHDARLGSVWSLLQTSFDANGADAVVREDQARLGAVLRHRRHNAETHGGSTGSGHRQFVPGRSWAAWSRGLGLLLPQHTVVDLGCGEGFLTLEVARWAAHVVAVDRSAPVLERARDLAARRQVVNVDWRLGEIEQPPVENGAADIALLSQALHHAEDPREALRAATRVVREHGRVLVLDLAAHTEEWTRERLGDRWLGFEAAELTEMMTDVGLVDLQVGPSADAAETPFEVLAAVGTKPATARRGK
ncbi:MAG: metalloregulator ArsR/SmtB family transcription factor [Vicinamibacterales bacterium]|nr:metalloregulator ArsR/SmtB family transcription factor [Vicinamibacterales bacterium]